MHFRSWKKVNIVKYSAREKEFLHPLERTSFAPSPCETDLYFGQHTSISQGQEIWERGRIFIHFALCVKEKDCDVAFISVPHITGHIQKYNSSTSFYKRQDIPAGNTVLSDYSTGLINEIRSQDSSRISKQTATLNKTVFWKWNMLLAC